MRLRRILLAPLLVVIAVPATLSGTDKDKRTDTISRLKAHVMYLASDELEGRGVGTKGIELAAEYLAKQFEELGLAPAGEEGTFFQQFPVVTGRKLVGTPTLELTLAESTKLTLSPGTDFTVLSFGGAGTGEAPLVFAGYGIRAPEYNYNDYADLDVKGKVVLVMRREPRQGAEDDDGPFRGKTQTRHSALLTKARLAQSLGAKAVLFVTDPFTLAKEEDTLMPFGYGGQRQAVRIPLFHIRRELADRLLKEATGKTLAELAEAIDRDLKPRSCPLDGVRVRYGCKLEQAKAYVRNVLAMLPGTGKHKDEFVVVGAHYDHVGLGGPGSLAPGTRTVHNGADDNASGTASVLELARRLKEAGTDRSILFILFAAEERGLLGSAHFVQHPTVPLEKVVAMINLDMVGRLRKDKLIVYGTGTAPEFGQWIPELAKQYGFDLKAVKTGFGPSDHASFYRKRIPVLHFFTDLHPDYHKPTDDWDKLNYEGMARIVDMVYDVVVRVANAPKRPAYVHVAPQRPRRGQQSERAYLGSVPSFGNTDVDGVLLDAVTEGGPAQKAGLKAGDVIVKIGDIEIHGLEDLDQALREYKPGQKVKVVVKRDNKELTFEVTLGRR